MPRASSLRSRLLRRLGLVLSYLALSVAAFYPQSLSPSDTVAYVGDSLESVYIVAWNVHQFFRSPLGLFDANVLYPLRHALAFTDHRLLPSLVVAPVVWITGNPVLAYNAAVALACLLAALAARFLALRLGADRLAAWTAGALYAFHTYQVNEAPRLNIVFHGFLPLALERLVSYLRTGERRQAWAVAGFLLLQGLSSNYHLLYGCLLLALVVAGSFIARPKVLARRAGPLVLAGVFAGLLFLPVALPYLELSREHGLARELPEGIDLRHYFSTAPGNLLYGPIGGEVRLQQRGPHFVGFVSLALALVALATRRRDADAVAPLVPSRVWVPAAAALALLLAALSLGRDMAAFGVPLGPGPYRLLYAYVPGFQLVRIPERLGLLAMLFVALLVARGLTVLRRAGFARVAVLLAVLVPAEHLSRLEVERVPVGREVPEVYAWLARHPVRALAEVPIHGEGLVREETLEMYFSTAHWRPIIHGYTAYPPLATRLLRRFAAQFPDDASLAALSRVGVDTIVVHHGRELGKDLAHQLGADGAHERWSRLLKLAGLDLYERLPEAVAGGRLERVARFEGPQARLFESSADEVYRIAGAPTVRSAPFPQGRRLSRPTWRYRTKAGDPLPAADGDLSTAWTVPRALRGDEFLEVVFDRPVPVSGVVLPLRRDSQFPTRFRIGARDLDGNWAEVARYDGPHRLQLLERTLADPARAAVGFALDGREVTGLNLLVEEGGTSFEGWRLPEFEVWVR